MRHTGVIADLAGALDPELTALIARSDEAALSEAYRRDDPAGQGVSVTLRARDHDQRSVVERGRAAGEQRDQILRGRRRGVLVGDGEVTVGPARAELALHRIQHLGDENLEGDALVEQGRRNPVRVTGEFAGSMP